MSDDNNSWSTPFKKFVKQFEIAGHMVETWPNVEDKTKIKYLVAWKPPHDISAELPNLAAIFNLGAGVDHLLLDDSLPKQVPIIRIVDDNLTNRMGEYVSLHCLTHLRSLNDARNNQKLNNWEDVSHPTASQVTVGIMGLGVIGSHCAKILDIIGFNVIGWSNSSKNIPNITSYAGDAQLDLFLGKTDILVNLLPHTAATDKIVNYQLLSKLNGNSVLGSGIFINAGRGKSQVEADVAKALRDGTLKAASLDVFEQEPLPKNSELWALENLIITPHNAASSDRITVTKQILGQIENFEKGNKLINIVDRSKGY